MNARPDMRDFQNHLEIPDISTIPVVRPEGACPGGMLSCPDLNKVDVEATDKLLRFVTQMTQGFAGYVDIMATITETYETGAENAANQLNVQYTYVPSLIDGPLPDIAPELSAPGPRGA